jgi:hypothetical protein
MADDQLPLLTVRALNDRAERIGPPDAADRIFAYVVLARKTARSSAAAPTESSEDRPNDVPSSVPPFTRAAADVAAQPKRQETEMTEAKITPRPTGLSTFKPG